MPAAPLLQQVQEEDPSASRPDAPATLQRAADADPPPFRAGPSAAAGSLSATAPFHGPVQRQKTEGISTIPFTQNRSLPSAPVQLQKERWQSPAASKPVIQAKSGINTQAFTAPVQRKGGRSVKPASLSDMASPNPFAALAINSNPGSVEEVAESLDASYKEWSGNDDTMLNILRGPFEANWFKARGALTMNQWPSGVPEDDLPDHNNSILFMNAMVDMRWRKWKAFTDIALQKMKSEVKATSENKMADDVKARLAKQGVDTKNPDLAKTLDPVGSMAVTSDIDLSLGGNNTEIAVGLINREFRSHFSVPYDPGTVFDINVYSSDWIHGAKGERKGDTMEYTPNAEVKMSAQAEQERDQEMEEWSLVKIIRNMTPDQWNTYRSQILDTMQDGDAKNKRTNTLDSAKAKCDAFKLRVKLRMESMSAELKAEEEKLLPAGSKSSFDEEFTHQAHETRASNAIYEEILIQVKELRLRLDEQRASERPDAARVDSLGKQLASKIAEALTYANEVYATEGAVQHTVLDQGAGKKLDKLKAEGIEEGKKAPGEKKADVVNQQTLKEVKYKLRKELFLQSANENVGDALHSLHTYHHLPYYAVYRAGKYLSRLIEATDKMFAEDAKRAQTIDGYTTLKDIGQNAMKIKSQKVRIGGKELEGDPKVVELDANFKNYKDSDLPAIESKIISFGAGVTIAFEAMNINEKTT